MYEDEWRTWRYSVRRGWCLSSKSHLAVSVASETRFCFCLIVCFIVMPVHCTHYADGPPSFYAVVPPKTSMPHSHKRTFISLPTKHHPTRESWKEVDIELEDQVEAHLGLFMRDKNKGYERLIGMVLDEIGLGVERA